VAAGKRQRREGAKALPPFSCLVVRHLQRRHGVRQIDSERLFQSGQQAGVRGFLFSAPRPARPTPNRIREAGSGTLLMLEGGDAQVAAQE